MNIESAKRFECETIVSITLISIAAVIGCGVPIFYQWSGCQQSHTPAIVFHTFYFLACLFLVFCGSLPWLSLSKQRPQTERFQFTLSSLIGQTTILALFFSLLVPFPFYTSLTVLVFSLWWVGYRLTDPTSSQSSRWQLVALIGCMWLPFAWAASRLFSEQTLLPLLGFPATVLAMIAGRLTEYHPFGNSWSPILLTALQLSIGVSIWKYSPRWAFAWTGLSLLSSMVGSLALYAAFRM